MKVNLPATKSNLIGIKKTLGLAREGYELLDEKRKILMAELTAILGAASRLQRQVDSALKEAYNTANRAVASMGRERLEELSLAVDIKSDLSISQRKIMGVSIPVIDVKVIENPPYYSPHNVSFYVEEAILKFKEILMMLAQIAEKKVAVFRIAAELKKTIRKVNALEKIHIPNYEETVKYMTDRLDEESRESLSMLKTIKKLLKK